LGYLQTRELAELPVRIEALESEQQAIHTAMADPEFYKQDQQNISNTHNRLAELEAAITAAYSRWEELEAFNR
jgi:ATP-binding cassette subfamily F protein uup